MATSGQVLDRQPPDSGLVDHVRVDVGEGALIERDQAARAERTQARDHLGRQLASRRDHADGMDPLAGAGEALRVRALEVDERGVAELLERLDHRADRLGDGRADRPVRHLDEHDLGAAGPQRQRDRVGLVPEPLGDLEYPVAGGGRDPVLLVGAVEDVADGGAGDAGGRGDVP